MDIFHDNKDARVIPLDNEICNMAIENLSMNDYFQAIKSKSDRLANLGSPVKDSSLVTYAINGVQSGVLDILNAHSSFHTTSSSPTVLVAMNASTARTNTMSTSGLKECRTFIVVHALMGPLDNCKTASSAPTPSRTLNVCESTRNSAAQEMICQEVIVLSGELCLHYTYHVTSRISNDDTPRHFLEHGYWHVISFS
ncbi:hypothetical protein Tco_0442552 [Tanacetum coccineum]